MREHVSLGACVLTCCVAGFEVQRNAECCHIMPSEYSSHGGNLNIYVLRNDMKSPTLRHTPYSVRLIYRSLIYCKPLYIVNQSDYSAYILHVIGSK